MVYTVESVRNDLRSIARKKKYIDSLSRTKQYLSMQINLLQGTTQDTSELKMRLQVAISALQRVIAESAEKESNYIRCVCALSNMHRTLILEHYVQGVAIWKVAEKVGYSERQASEHLRRAVIELTKLLNKRMG